MKKFVFPLQNVLKLRHHETELAKQELGRRTRDVQEGEEFVRAAQARVRELSETAAGTFGPIELRRQDAYRREAQASLEEARQRLENLRREEARAREVLMHKRRDEEAIKILFEQQKATFLKAQESAENAFLDEQAISGHNRKTRQEQPT